MKKANRLLALLLAAVMVLSMAACGKQAAPQAAKPVEQNKNPENQQQVQNLPGGEKDEAVEPKEDGTIVNLGNSDKLPTADNTINRDAYDENGAMTKPFDQVYPELIEQEQISFSGETILIKMKSDVLTDGLKAAGVGALEVIVPMEGAAWYEAKLTEGTDAKKALAAVRELKEVLLAEYNYEIETAALDHYKDFGDRHKEKFDKNKHYKDQWHFHHCGIPDAFEQMETDGGDSSVIVAVIDSGVDYDHEDLKDNMWINSGEIPNNNRDDDGNGYVDDYYGVDIVAGKGSGDDTNGHGTHVAGIIAARNNNVGVLGIAYNVKIMSVKAAMHNGILNQADIAKAVLYAYENGAEVVNMSFGGTACSIAVQDALATAYTRCVLVASAGNSGYPNEPTDYYPALPSYPAALTYVLGVMSVDETGRESVFTNWDAYAFNGVEYELYAPGENIMSTLPNNQYGYLSGTSMAAPVVSAFAAILRSEFSDRDMYPTKFIYGQLASTSGNYADCCAPEKHTVGGLPHNLPQIANLHDALTKLPKPELSVQEYYVFDDPKYSDKNNGDGVIDAGETIALGLVIRNRWGMSENTLVTIDTISASSGMADPYFTILNPTVDYGSVGTYSTQDCGKVYTDELFTGWENPFLIRVSEDCPNDYRFTLNIKITCENALDAEDTTVYTSVGKVDENVRAGYILPSVIEEDMVLTKDNLYIIPNATVITEGTTVRVEPGTHIQFWSDDANDPYADSYIAYLLVNGNFLVEGTKEDPVYIYPSQLMDRYGVEIGSSSTGYVSLKYADVTNFFYFSGSADANPSSYGNHTGTGNHIDLADHCTFRNNYSGSIRYRYLSAGVVRDNGSSSVTIGNVNARDCVFYKLAFSGTTYLHGTAERCIFTQCGIDYKGTYENCTFLGNSMVDQTNPNTHYNSSINAGTGSTPRVIFVKYNAETGTTYIEILGSEQVTQQFLAEQLQMEVVSYPVFESAEDAQTVCEIILSGSSVGSYTADAGIRYDQTTGKYVWSDGSAIDSALDPDNLMENGFRKLYLSFTKKAIYYEGLAYVSHYEYSCKLTTATVNVKLYEIPGQILPTDITFTKYTVDMDMESTYQITPMNSPVQLPTDSFLYESTDESVLTVSHTGLVTPVGEGTADVWVYSLDRAVRNRVTITVRDYVALEDLTFPADTTVVAIGETLAMGCTLTPANTTRRNVTYTTSNSAVATVDAGGNITGIASGTAVITATCEGITDTLTVTVYQKATSLTLRSLALSVALSDGTLKLPEVVASAGAELDLSWRSTDEAVAVIEDGNLILKALGTTSLVVTDSRSGLSATCLVIVSETSAPAIRDVQSYNAQHWVLLENGDLYQWTNSYRTEPTRIDTDVAMIDLDYSYLFALQNDGTILKYYNLTSSNLGHYTYTAVQGWDIVDFAANGNNFFVRTANGNVYAWGAENTYGQLGLGTANAVAAPSLVNLDGIVDIFAENQTTWFLTDKGELYATGNLHYTTTATPVLIDTGVAQMLRAGNYDCYYLSVDGRWKNFNGIGLITYKVDLSALDQVAFCSSRDTGIGIKDGKVYTFQYDSTVLTEIPGITDAVDVYTYEGIHYIVTESDLLFGFGNNSVSDNHMAGVTTENPVTTPVLIPILPLAEETVTVTDTDLADGVLVGDTLTLTFNKALNVAAPKLYADGVQVTVQSAIADYNHLTVSRSAGFAEAVTYELVFAPGTLHCAGGITNTEELRIAFTYAPGEASEDTTEEAPVVYESILDQSIQRILTSQRLTEALTDYLTRTQYNPKFYGNVILNPISTDFEVSHWLRPLAPSISAGSYSEIPFGGNYWGTTNETAIGLQMIDYTDFVTYARLMYKPYLTEAPENTFPFVTSVTLWNKNGEQVTVVGNETITFRVTFNRDMDTSIPLLVRFGSAFPYGDYEIEGKYVDARTWEGTYTLNTLIENGYQYFTISNGCSATDDLQLQLDQYRFSFEIDTTAAQALIMQGTASDTGIELKWTQDDFKTLMGYNVYRSTSEDGYYTRLNSTVIPANTMTWFDTTVEPGVVYYYNFTVVQTDLSESEPSGKIVIMSRDTMAPNIYHSPVGNAFTDANLVVSATVTDNLNIAYANLYYRIAGQTEWTIIRMNKLNDKYSAIIPAQYLTTAGLEYYIEAFDGISYTYNASADAPYAISVQEAIGADALGDVDGDGVITNLDALLLLYTINDKYNMTAEEFARADLNGDGVLWAAEALQILRYVSGEIGSVKM